MPAPAHSLFTHTLGHMGSFLAISAVLFFLPLLIIVACSANYARFYFGGEAVEGTVVDAYSRAGIDDDANPVTRYYGAVAYPANEASYLLNDYGPHDQPLVAGTKLAVRYLRKNPGNAIAWPGKGIWWLALLFVFCSAIELRILGSLFG